MSEQRYQIRDGSQSCHCCFDCTVIDTTKPRVIHGEHYRDSSGQLQYEPVCECFEREDAERVCDALNAVDGLKVVMGDV